MARPVNENGLTEQQERFVNAYMSDGDCCASSAYRVAYPKSREWQPQSVHVKASELLANGKVRVRLAQLRRFAASSASLTLAEAKEILSGIARHEVTDSDDVSKVGPVVIRSIERLAKMEQWDAPDQLQVEQVSFNLTLAPEAASESPEREPGEVDAQVVSMPTEPDSGEMPQ